MKKKDKGDVAREIHHRVKNNLQIIASILRLQMRGEESPAAQKALSGAINRINGMVQVHDLLSRTDAKTVDLKELLERLVDLNIQTFLLPGQVIRHEVTGESIRVDADTALNVTLAANELVVNTLKHAFSGRKEGRVNIEVGAHEVTVTDDGVGLPEGFTLTGSANLGLRLVQSVVKDDLKGTFDISSGKEGTKAVLRFPPLTE